MKWECDLYWCTAWFNLLRLGCHSDGGDINMNSFSQAAFFIIAANVLYRENCYHCRQLLCSGFLGAASGASAKTRLRIQWSSALLHAPYCWGPSPEPLFLTPLLFKTLPLLCALLALYFSPKDPLSPKSFLRGYSKYSGTHFRLDVPWKVDSYLSCVQIKPTAHF